MAGWNDELLQWLEPFMTRLGHKRRRQMCPLYVAGLIGPGERKSMEPIAARLAPNRYDRLHHFISSGVWDIGPVEEELARQADRMVGGSDAVLVIDDTALPKKGVNSVGVAPQYASALGKRANCQTLVSLTLAREEVPVAVPGTWALATWPATSQHQASMSIRSGSLCKRPANMRMLWSRRAQAGQS